MVSELTATIRRLLAPVRPGALALALLVLAAVGVLVAGFQHARLLHRGYAEVEVVPTGGARDAVPQAFGAVDAAGGALRRRRHGLGRGSG